MGGLIIPVEGVPVVVGEVVEGFGLGLGLVVVGPVVVGPVGGLLVVWGGGDKGCVVDVGGAGLDDVVVGGGFKTVLAVVEVGGAVAPKST